MSDDPIEFLLPWEGVQVELTLDEANDPDVVMQRLIEATIDKRVTDEAP